MGARSAEAYHQRWFEKQGQNCGDHGFIGPPWAASVGRSAEMMLASSSGH